MRKTIQRIGGILVLCILAFVVFAVVNDILRLKVGQETDMVHSFYDIEENTLDVLGIGSSHSYHSIQPGSLWGEYGIPSYVMSSPSQPVACSYYLLKEMLRYQNPKVVLLETFSFREETQYNTEGYLRSAIDGIHIGKVKTELLEDFFPNYSWKQKLSYYIPFLVYHNRWSELKNYDFNRVAWMKGGVLDFRVVPQTEPEFPEKPLKLPKNTRKYLKKIIDLCEENGIQLILYAAPMANNWSVKKALRINLSVEKYAAKRGIPFFFYQKTKELGIDYETDFYDDQHLNTYGTDKLTKHIAEWMVQNCGLTDHRQEEKYKSWDEDYERFNARREKMLEARKEN